MLRSKDLDKLGIFNVMTSRNHETHRRTLTRYLRLIRISFLYKIPPIIGWLQVQIARKIGGAEWAVEEGKKRINELKANFSSAQTVEEKKSIQEEISGFEYQQSINKHLIKEWKLMADAIAWRILKYQRLKIRILSENNSSGLLDFKSEGTKEELASIMELSLFHWKLVIWSELTNYIRIGDILVRHSDKEFEILEVKVKPNSKKARIKRQEKRMDDVTKIFNSNVINTSRGQVLMDRVNVPLNTNVQAVSELIKEARKSYVACKKIDEVVSICVHDYGLVEKDLRKEPDVKLIKKNVNVDFPQKKHDRILTCTSFDYLRREGGEFPRTLAPLTIFPFKPSVITEILSGKLLITVFVDLKELEGVFKERGWKIKEADLKQIKKDNERIWKSGHFRQKDFYSDIIDDTLFEISKGDYHTTIPFPLVMRLGYEFLSTQSLIDIAEGFKRRSDQRRHIVEQYDVFGFAFELTEEKHLWK